MNPRSVVPKTDRSGDRLVYTQANSSPQLPRSKLGILISSSIEEHIGEFYNWLANQGKTKATISETVNYAQYTAVLDTSDVSPFLHYRLGISTMR